MASFSFSMKLIKVQLSAIRKIALYFLDLCPLSAVITLLTSTVGTYTFAQFATTPFLKNTLLFSALIYCVVTVLCVFIVIRNEYTKYCTNQKTISKLSEEIAHDVISSLINNDQSKD